MEKENNIKTKEIQNRDIELIKLKEKNITQEALIINLNNAINTLEKDYQKARYKVYTPTLMRSRTPDAILYKKKAVNNNNGNNSQSRHLIYNI